MEAKINLVDTPTRAMWRAIAEPIARYNEARVGQAGNHLPLVIALEGFDDNEVVGGLWGTTAYSNLHIELMFIPDPLRNKGLGTRLLHLAEQEAIRRGCHCARVEAYSFGALGFYEHRGYSRFGELQDCPVGHSLLFLRKTLMALNSTGAPPRRVV